MTHWLTRTRSLRLMNHYKNRQTTAVTDNKISRRLAQPEKPPHDSLFPYFMWITLARRNPVFTIVNKRKLWRWDKFVGPTMKSEMVQSDIPQAVEYLNLC